MGKRKKASVALEKVMLYSYNARLFELPKQASRSHQLLMPFQFEENA